MSRSSDLKRAQDYFKEVRDKPYRVPLSVSDADHSCFGKSILLKTFLDNLELIARYRLCDFLWSDFNLPSHVLACSHDKPALHVFVEIQLNSQWFVLDPTWDKNLKSLLPISEWKENEPEGTLAVNPIKLHSPKMSLTFMKAKTSETVMNQNLTHNNFYLALNQHFESVRKTSL